MSRNAELVRLIRDRAGAEAPEFGLILGSGLGHLSAAVEGVAIPYADLPGFPQAGVSGHFPSALIGSTFCHARDCCRVDFSAIRFGHSGPSAHSWSIRAKRLGNR